MNVSHTHFIRPYLTPSDSHVFERLKEAMGGNHLGSDKEVKTAVHVWLQSKPKQFSSQGIRTSEPKEHGYFTS